MRNKVTEEEVAEVVSKWTGIPVSKMLEGEREKLLGMEDNLHRRVIGQEAAVTAVSNAVRRARAAGLESRIQILELDYRDLPAALGRRFSRLVSIEMVEAVGARHFGTFMETCGRLLADGAADEIAGGRSLTETFLAMTGPET